MIALTCSSCEDPYSVQEALHAIALRRGQTKFYCSPKCANDAKKATVTLVCGYCETPFKRKAAEIRRSTTGNYFCSTSCSNKKRIRKKKVREPKPQRIPLKDSDRTKGDLFQTRTTWQSARSAIQKAARATFKADNPTPACAVCGYTKHVEVCHRRDVSDFPETATVREINHPSNLVGLCPTHHWEFDNGCLNGPLPNPDGA